MYVYLYLKYCTIISEIQGMWQACYHVRLYYDKQAFSSPAIGLLRLPIKERPVDNL